MRTGRCREQNGHLGPGRSVPVRRSDDLLPRRPWSMRRGMLADVDNDGICDYEVILYGATNDTLWMDECRVVGQVIDDCGTCNTPAAGRFYKDALTGETCAGTPNCFLTNTSNECGCDGEVFNTCDVCGGPRRIRTTTATVRALISMRMTFATTKKFRVHRRFEMQLRRQRERR